MPLTKNCLTCNKEFKTCLSNVKRGRGIWCSKSCRPAWNKGVPNTWYNPKGLEIGWKHQVRFKKGQIAAMKGKPNLKIRGENHYNWKGGITPINKKLRESIEYEEWRKKVFERDLYTCQKCGEIGGRLEADHIKPWALYSELRFELNNGQTLCKECHNVKTYSEMSLIQKQIRRVDL